MKIIVWNAVKRSDRGLEVVVPNSKQDRTMHFDDFVRNIYQSVDALPPQDVLYAVDGGRVASWSGLVDGGNYLCLGGGMSRVQSYFLPNVLKHRLGEVVRVARNKQNKVTIPPSERCRLCPALLSMRPCATEGEVAPTASPTHDGCTSLVSTRGTPSPVRLPALAPVPRDGTRSTSPSLVHHDTPIIGAYRSLRRFHVPDAHAIARKRNLVQLANSPRSITGDSAPTLIPSRVYISTLTAPALDPEPVASIPSMRSGGKVEVPPLFGGRRSRATSRIDNTKGVRASRASSRVGSRAPSRSGSTCSTVQGMSTGRHYVYANRIEFPKTLLTDFMREGALWYDEKPKRGDIVVHTDSHAAYSIEWILNPQQGAGAEATSRSIAHCRRVLRLSEISLSLESLATLGGSRTPDGFGFLTDDCVDLSLKELIVTSAFVYLCWVNAETTVLEPIGRHVDDAMCRGCRRENPTSRAGGDNLGRRVPSFFNWDDGLEAVSSNDDDVVGYEEDDNEIVPMF